MAPTKPRTTPQVFLSRQNADAKTPAPAVEFLPATFGDADVPEVTRRSTVVNPLMEVCGEIAKTIVQGEDGKFKSRIAKTVHTANPEQVAKVKRWLALASTSLGVTMRSVVKDDGTVVFWAVPKITHKVKDGDAE